MCGIAGFWNVQAGRPLSNVTAMLEAMQHRGPDGQGTLEYEGGAAGMVRLALVDLSDRGQQPLWSDDGRVAILFNGEMYNFREQRSRLEALGHRFYTTTDTEVLLKLYLEHGLGFHEHVRGMFALAIFDWRQTRPGRLPQLLLARGPLGIKHLYVYHPAGRTDQVVFSSEIRSLLASGLVPREVNLEGLAGCLSLGFVPQPETVLSGVRMLEPATIEVYRPGEPMFRKRFWQMPAYQPKRESLDEAAERLRAVLDESVALHAMADAPVGAFLSGGIDSTGIVALMRPRTSDLRTYTLRFPEIADSDEADEAAATAKQLDCRHTEVVVTGEEVAAILPRFSADLDQPSADGLNTWLISRAAARDVKGILSGIGGDEWFSGYPSAWRMSRLLATRLGRLQSLAGGVAHLFADWMPLGPLRQPMESLSARRNTMATWLQPRTAFSLRAARALLGLPDRGISAEARFETMLADDGLDIWRETPIGLSCLLDTCVYMTQQLLRDADASSMAHSLELRVPLVDIELVNYSRTCADEYRLAPDGGSYESYETSGSKRVLIKALSDVLPEGIGQRRKKGFALPIAHWMRNAMRPLVEDTCGDASVKSRGLLDPALVARTRQGLEAGVQSAAYPCMWTLMVIELWMRGVVDRQPSKQLACT
ncbi:MAG: asparagine synthase (glutamine-hydrolyzing) [Planctomycetota bacterium]|nr:MAG: asparagine synthase (glutamine-hydrolyzing) [Planctomycetota bacterium]